MNNNTRKRLKAARKDGAQKPQHVPSKRAKGKVATLTAKDGKRLGGHGSYSYSDDLKAYNAGVR